MLIKSSKMGVRNYFIHLDVTVTKICFVLLDISLDLPSVV